MTKKELSKLNVDYYSDLKELGAEFHLNKHKQLVIKAGNLSITSKPTDTPISLIKFLRRIS